MADNIIIDFQVNDEGLQPVEDRLADLGKVDAAAAQSFKKTNTELAKRQALLKNIADGSQQVVLSVTKEQTVYNKLVTSLKSLSGESKKTVENLLKMKPEAVAAGFDNAAVSADDFLEVLKGVGKEVPTTTEGLGGLGDTLKGAGDEAVAFEGKALTLKQELKTLTAQIAAMKLSGDDAGDSFTALVQRAGAIKDAISDAGSEIKNFSSDTRTVDNVIGSVTALAGGFAAVQGAAALFGDENKDLQETLVKVSATMSVLQGVQAVQNALQKEGALSLLALNIQEKAAVINTQLLTAAESENVVVSALATIGIRAFNAALAANPIGLFVTALLAVIGIFAYFINKAGDAAEAVGKLNNAIYNGTTGLDAYADGSKRALDKITSDLEKAGARQSELQKAQGKQSADLINKRTTEIKNLNQQIIEQEHSTNADVVESRGKALETVGKLEQQQADAIVDLHKQQNAFDKQLIEENLQDRIEANKKILTQAAEGTRAQLEAQKALIKAQAALDIQDAGQDPAKVAAIQAQAQKDTFEAEVAFQRRLADLRTQAIEKQIEDAHTVDATDQELYVLELKRITAAADADVLNTKLSEKEKKAVRDKANSDRAAASKAFNELDRKNAIQAEIDKNQVLIDQRNVSNADALAASEANIVLTAQLEIDATKNNNEKVLAIMADRDAKIRQARLASIQKELADELTLRSAANGPLQRAIAQEQTQFDDSLSKRKISLDAYYRNSVELINGNKDIELDTNQLKIDSLNAELKAKAISEKDYNIQYATLADERVAIEDDAQAKIRAAGIKTVEQKKKDAEEIRDFAIQTAGEAGNLILNIFQNQLASQQASVDAQKQKIQDLNKAGIINDKEAEKRMNALAQQERRIKYEQAQRDKQQAIFNAIINTALSVSKAYATVGPIAGPVLAAIAAAIGAAQIALIASQPIPQFFRGKQPGLYEGFGQVAEHGPEGILREDGSWHVQKDRGLVWLGKNDQVFTASQTQNMVQSPSMRSMPVQQTNERATDNFDYTKLAKMIADNPVHVAIDGIEAMIKDGLSTTNMLNARRRYSK